MRMNGLLSEAWSNPELEALCRAVDQLLATELDGVSMAKLSAEIEYEAWLDQPAYQRRGREQDGREIMVAARVADLAYEQERRRAWRLYVLDGDCVPQ